MRPGLLAATGVLLFAPAVSAQAAPVRVEQNVDCRWGDRDRDRYCEVREYRLDARADLAVDAGTNGGIEVAGWDRDEVRLVARLAASSRHGDPRRIAAAVEIRTGSVIEATGPHTRGRDEQWSVNYELMVPRATALRLRASNGGITLDGLTGDVSVRTTNGGIRLTGGAGQVRGETTNGGLHLDLTGATWHGPGVELRTTNGGIQIRVPEGYSAELETGTVNGRLDLGIPIMVQGRIDRTLRTRLGDGGPMIRATTTNGGVTIRR